MARLAKGEHLNPDEVQIMHGVQRCVRRLFCVVMIRSRAQLILDDASLLACAMYVD